VKALEVARAQEARSLELRAACDLARLWAEQGRRSEARGPDMRNPSDMRRRARVHMRGQYSGSAVRAHLKLTSASTTV